MKPLRKLACSLAIVLCAFTAGAQQVAADSSRLSGDWYLQPVLPSDTATGRIPMLSFNLSTRNFKGFTGCNQMSGSFRVTGDAISFDKDITLTRMACEGFNEKEFLTNLFRVDHYQFRDGMLILLINKTPISKWMRKDTKIMTTE